jgi:hypothetical protein
MCAALISRRLTQRTGSSCLQVIFSGFRSNGGGAARRTQLLVELLRSPGKSNSYKLDTRLFGEIRLSNRKP